MLSRNMAHGSTIWWRGMHRVAVEGSVSGSVLCWLQALMTAAHFAIFR